MSCCTSRASTVKNVIADDVQKELKRLDDAITALRADLDLMLERRDVADGGEHREVLDAYRSSRTTRAGCTGCARRSAPA